MKKKKKKNLFNEELRQPEIGTKSVISIETCCTDEMEMENQTGKNMD